MNILNKTIIKIIKIYKFLISPLIGDSVDIYPHVLNIVLKL